MSDNNTPQSDDRKIVELTEQLDRERTRANNFQGQLTDIQKRMEAFNGIDLDKLKADSEALKQLTIEKAKNSGDQKDIDELLASTEKRIRDEIQPQLETFQTENKTLKSKINEIEVVDAAYTQIGTLFNNDVQEFIKGLIRQNVAKDKDGNLVVVDKDGKPRYSNGSANKLMSVAELGDELAQKYPSFAQPTVTSGTRSQGQRSNGASVDVQRYLNMTAAQRAELPKAERMKLAEQAVKL